MLLTELHGYKRYVDKTFDQILSALKARIARDGANSIVVVPRGDQPYVYKAWMKDEAYEAYLELIKTLHGNPYVPKVGPIKKVPLFFKRQGHVDGHLNVVKIERLEPSHSSASAELLARLLQELLNAKLNGSDEFAKQFAASFFKKSEFAGDEHLIEFVVALKRLHDQHGDNFAADCRSDNIMLRGSQLVVTDPLTTGYDREQSQKNSGVLFMQDLSDTFDGEPAVLKSGSRPKVHS